MKDLWNVLQWIALVGGTVVLFAGMLDAGKDAVPIVGAILVGSALIAVRRD